MEFFHNFHKFIVYVTRTVATFNQTQIESSVFLKMKTKADDSTTREEFYRVLILFL